MAFFKISLYLYIAACNTLEFLCRIALKSLLLIIYIKFQSKEAGMTISFWQGVNEGNLIVLFINQRTH